MHPLLVVKLAILLTVANGTPVLAKKCFGNRFAQPIDGGLVFFDGRRLFGPTKTVRGAMVSVVLTTVAAWLMGMEAALGALAGSTAMIGDLLSSFVKRRLGFAPSSRATGFDQIPESLIPLLACRAFLPLTAVDILMGVAIFSFGAIVLSPLFNRVGLRDRPF